MEKTQVAKPNDEGSATIPLGKLSYSNSWWLSEITNSDIKTVAGPQAVFEECSLSHLSLLVPFDKIKFAQMVLTHIVSTWKCWMDGWVSRWMDQQRWLKVVMEGWYRLWKARQKDLPSLLPYVLQLKCELRLGPICRCSWEALTTFML